MSITIKKINDVTIKPIPKLIIPDSRPILGQEITNIFYPNIGMIARKNSGKTTCIYTILKKCVNRFTKVYFFVSTLYKDASYKSILKYCELKKYHMKDILAYLMMRVSLY